MPRGRKPELSMQEMLRRIPDRDWLTTKEVQHVFNDCHQVTVYRYVQQGLLTAKKIWGKRASRYMRSEVVALVRSRFIPPDTDTESSNGQKKTRQLRQKKS